MRVDVQAAEVRRQTSWRTSRFCRATVQRVYERECTAERARGPVAQTERVLQLSVTHAMGRLGEGPGSGDAPLTESLFCHDKQALATPVQATALLRDEWLHVAVAEGDCVHLVGTWEAAPASAAQADNSAPAPAEGRPDEDADLWDDLDESIFEAVAEPSGPTMVLSSLAPTGAASNDNLMVVHPDMIISASRLASVASCMRKPMIQERIKALDDTSYAAAFGNMVHALLQACLLDEDAASGWDRLGNFSDAFLDAQIERQLAAARDALFLLGVSADKVRAELRDTKPALVTFAKTYLARRDGSDVDAEPAAVDDPRSESPQRVRITRVLSAEDDVVSPMYGLKGRLDVCAEAEVFDGNERFVGILPLEVKSGRVTSSMEHAAQTSLYTLLLADRYGLPVASGYLLYTQNGTLRRVQRNLREVRSLVLARNEMAAFRVQMPVLAGESSEEEGQGTAETQVGPDENVSAVAASSAPAEAVPPGPPFLPPTIDSEFKCSRCYARDGCMLYRRAIEQVEDTSSPIAPLYAQLTQHLSAGDLAFFLHWDALLSHEEQGLGRFQRELWTLPLAEREATGRSVGGLRWDSDAHRTRVRLTLPDARRSVLASGLALDDLVLLSTQAPRMRSLGRGRVVAIAPAALELALEQDVARALEQTAQLAQLPPHGSDALPAQFTFRVDQEELMSMMAVARFNLACLFYAQAPVAAAHVKQCVVNLAAPRFAYTLPPATGEALARFAGACNEGQRRAIEQALLAQDYALVLGMPGTGKTTTIATLIRILVALGQSVLLCSYTHSAVDTILSKLHAAHEVDVLRLGAVSRIHPSARRYALAERLAPDASVEEYEALIEKPPVVAATCLATNDPVFARRRFDVCIVDEASQITLPTCLGPLRFADRFVMIGDHHQLAPLVRDRRAARRGMQVSVFQRLCEAHPSALVHLRAQYRMNAAIMALSNALVYGGRLTAGSTQVATGSLALDKEAVLAAGKRLPETQRWMAAMARREPSVVFLDTDALPARECRLEGLVENEGEAELIASLVRFLRACGVPAAHLGVLTPYRQQARRLRQAVTSAAGADAEVLTVDQAQGRDWPVVIASFVRSNEQRAAGELLRDMRRLNVLVTRAQHKLVLLGSRTTLRGRTDSGVPAEAPVPRLLALLEAQGRIVQLPKGAAAGGASRSPAVPSKVSPTKARPVKTQRTAGRPVLAEIMLNGESQGRV